MSFTYNADGIRTSKSYYDEVTEYILDGSRIIAEVKGSDIFVYIYDELGLPIGIKYRTANSTAYEYFFFEKNLQGDIVAIYNDSGAKIASYVYDAWGNFTKTQTSGVTYSAADTFVYNNNPFTYRGYYYDIETGLYYLQTRYYDASSGRFFSATMDISIDNLFVGYNRYAYMDNMPISSANFSLRVPEGKNALSYSASYKTNYIIRYDVPLYNQQSYSLCWAFCQVMVEDYNCGVVRTNDEATERAIEIAKSVHGLDDWDKGGWPTNRQEGYISVANLTINDLYEILRQQGPIYAYYAKSGSAHLIVVTGVDLTNGIVYTNNPWGKYGEQTYDEFKKYYVGQSENDRTPLVYYIYIN